jgi:hypothetical protein
LFVFFGWGEAMVYIFRSFVLSRQIEFAAMLNRSLATCSTTH